MHIVPLFFLLVLVVLVVWFISQPFGRHRIQRSASADHEISSLLAERDRVLDALQELDFDNVMGKVPAGEYSAQRAVLLQKGAGILRQLDSIAPAAREEESVEKRIEAAVAERRASLSDDEIESLVAARRASRKDRSGGFCPKCGKPVLASDRFCPACGKAIK